MSPRLVAALYVDKEGAYAGLEGVDLWDEERDARNYTGPHPVVAHPPCSRWSRLAGFTESRFGYQRQHDRGCFKCALVDVRRFGGVIEHPAYSDAWAAFGLPRPTVREGWTLDMHGGASCYVEQGRYGLPVKKATWLYAFGVSDLPELRWGYTTDREGDDIGGMDAWRDRWGGRADAVRDAMPDSERVVLGQERRGRNHMGLHSTTPPEFRDVLLALARSAYSERTVAA